MILTVAVYLNGAPAVSALDLSIARFRKAVTFEALGGARKGKQDERY